MKGNSAMFPFMTLCIASIPCMNIEQNLDYDWFLKPHALGKLTISIICLSVKQNLGHVWLLESHTLGKLILVLIQAPYEMKC